MDKRKSMFLDEKLAEEDEPFDWPKHWIPVKNIKRLKLSAYASTSQTLENEPCLHEEARTHRPQRPISGVPEHSSSASDDCRQQSSINWRSPVSGSGAAADGDSTKGGADYANWKLQHRRLNCGLNHAPVVIATPSKPMEHAKLSKQQAVVEDNSWSNSFWTLFHSNQPKSTEVGKDANLSLAPAEKKMVTVHVRRGESNADITKSKLSVDPEGGSVDSVTQPVTTCDNLSLAPAEKKMVTVHVRRGESNADITKSKLSVDPEGGSVDSVTQPVTTCVNLSLAPAEKKMVTVHVRRGESNADITKSKLSVDPEGGSVDSVTQPVTTCDNLSLAPAEKKMVTVHVRRGESNADITKSKLSVDPEGGSVDSVTQPVTTCVNLSLAPAEKKMVTVHVRRGESNADITKSKLSVDPEGGSVDSVTQPVTTICVNSSAASTKSFSSSASSSANETDDEEHSDLSSSSSSNWSSIGDIYDNKVALFGRRVSSRPELLSLDRKIAVHSTVVFLANLHFDGVTCQELMRELLLEIFTERFLLQIYNHKRRRVLDEPLEQVVLADFKNVHYSIISAFNLKAHDRQVEVTRATDVILSEALQALRREYR